jgi:hypothetical protein
MKLHLERHWLRIEGAKVSVERRDRHSREHKIRLVEDGIREEAFRWQGYVPARASHFALLSRGPRGIARWGALLHPRAEDAVLAK